MNHRAGFDRHQTLLLPETLEDYVGPEHTVCFLEAFVTALDLAALGFTKVVPRETGRPLYDPADLLRLYLYGYLHRVRSSRQLERECLKNLEVLWLLRKLAPDHKTIADFRKDNLAALRGVWRQLIQSPPHGSFTPAGQHFVLSVSPPASRLGSRWCARSSNSSAAS